MATSEANRVKRACDRARSKDLSADLTPQQWEQAKIYWKHSCAYCGSGKATTIDHYIPIDHGGGTVYNNVVPACDRCNKLKGNKPARQVFSPKVVNKIQKYFELLSITTVSLVEEPIAIVQEAPLLLGSIRKDALSLEFFSLDQQVVFQATSGSQGPLSHGSHAYQAIIGQLTATETATLAMQLLNHALTILGSESSERPKRGTINTSISTTQVLTSKQKKG